MTTASTHDSSPGIFKALRWLLLGAIPLTALLYAASWNQLPERMATHFAADGQANGWMSRQDSLTFSLVLTTIIAIVGILVLSRVKRPDVLTWAGLGLLYFVLSTVLWGNASIINYNVSGHPVNTTPIAIIAIVTIGLSLAFALFTRRGQELPSANAFATETHASPLFAFMMAAMCAALALLAVNIRVPVARVVVGAGSFVLLGAAAMAGGGFRYSFSKPGLEIRTLGFRLRSIPAADIRSYAVDRWNALGGYGIRGIGNRRAYVWGNRGVRIQTAQGEVFLGHNEPQRIVRDLDRITGGVSGKQVLNG